MKLYMF